MDTQIERNLYNISIFNTYFNLLEHQMDLITKLEKILSRDDTRYVIHKGKRFSERRKMRRIKTLQ